MRSYERKGIYWKVPVDAFMILRKF